MFCPNCGKEIGDGAKFCTYCGDALLQEVSAGQQAPNLGDAGGTPISQSKKIKCPNCGGRNLQSISDTSTTVTSKGYSGTKGCLGFLLFGPCGLLCGNCGSKTTTSTDTKTYWVCSDCGHKFRNLSEWKKEIEDLKKSSIVIAITFIALWALFGFATALENDLAPLFLLGTILIVIVILTLYFSIRKASNDYEILERSSMD